MSVDETWLSAWWFVHNYIRKCLQLNDCKQNISWLFDDVSTSMKLHNAVSALVAWRQNRSLLDLWDAFDAAEFYIPSLVCSRSRTARSCVCWMTQLTKIDSHLSIYVRAVALLHVASRSLRHGLTDELMDILATVRGPVSYTHLTLPTILRV